MPSPPLPAAQGLAKNPRKDESLVTYSQWLVAAFAAWCILRARRIIEKTFTFKLLQLLGAISARKMAPGQAGKHPRRAGSYQEYQVIDQSALRHRPPNNEEGRPKI
jgi:hypothetical protein